MSAEDGSEGRHPLEIPRGEAPAVMVSSPALDSDARRAYFESFVPAAPTETHVLAVNYTRTPEEWLEDWRSHVGQPPAACTVVGVGDGLRSATVVAVPEWVDSSVATPSDLTGLGITIGEHLAEWQGREVIVSFDSLTALLQYVDLKQAFRFLHVMTSRAKAAGAESHYHVDAAAHDDRAIATLSSLFDAVVEYEDGDWTVRSR